jgi:hypothetical protein
MGGGTIAFNIPGAGVQTISPLTVLPSIIQAVTIDGYTQPGSTSNTNPPTQGINAVILIELSGAMAPPNSNFSGLTINADNCTVRGLVINSFQHDAIDASSNGNVITGNFIGTNAAGTAALPNGSGGVGAVIIGGTSSNNTIGGTTPAARNLISGNIGEGVFFQLGTGNTVQGNFIGTDVTGTLALGNTDRGILTTASNTLIGGTTVDARNVISGNNRGVDLNGGSTHTVQGNFIGTDVSGTTALSNPNVGLNINSGVSNNMIGGLTATPGTPPGNLISGTSSNYGVIVGNPASGNLIQGNIIGADTTGIQPLGNLGGVQINGPGNTVGGTASGAGNIIAFNGTMCASPNDIGVAIIGDASTTNNAILGNSIFSNGGLGIDLIGNDTGPCGETPNDHCDVDTGPNDLQNYPVITSVMSGGGNVTLSGTLDSVANTAFRVEFFSSPACHSSGFGQGKHFLGSNVTTTDANCSATFGPVIFPLPAGDTVVTATATRLGSLAGCVTSPSGMVSWWPGDDNANDIQDGNNGTLQGATTFAPGEVQQAFSFNGVDAYIDVPQNNNLNPTAPFTVDAWVKADPSQSFPQVLIVDKSHGFTDSTGWLMQTNPDGTACFGYGLGGGGTTNFIIVCTQASILDGQWHHLAGVWTGTEIQMYEDAALENAVSSTSAPVNNTRNVHIGTAWGGGTPTRFFRGLVDEVEYFNRALSQPEIQSLVNAGSAGKCKLTTELETSEFSQCANIPGASPTPGPRVSPIPRSRPTPRARPTSPPHLTPVPPPPSPRPTASPRPTQPPHITPVPTPSSPRPTPAPRP